jgi:hypothetical protein
MEPQGINQGMKIKAFYTVKHLRRAELMGGKASDEMVLLSEEKFYNVVPLQSRNACLNSFYMAVTPPTAWYIGIFEGNYTPVDGDTAATFPASATESTAYNETVRQTANFASSTAGSCTNSASLATFTINASKTIYGAFISTASAKSATTGTLGSAAQFATAKVCVATDLLQVTYTVGLS